MNSFGPVQNFNSVVDMTANVHRCVRITGDNQVGPMSALGQVSVGVQLNKPPSTSGGAIDVQTTGRVPVYAGAAITAGVKVAPTAAGAVRTAAAGDHVIGIARTGSDGTANQPMIDVELHIGGAPLP